jgi:hypothetical protein
MSIFLNILSTCVRYASTLCLRGEGGSAHKPTPMHPRLHESYITTINCNAFAFKFVLHPRKKCNLTLNDTSSYS